LREYFQLVVPKDDAKAAGTLLVVAKCPALPVVTAAGKESVEKDGPAVFLRWSKDAKKLQKKFGKK
jgi:hypothetical protein